MDRSGFEPWPGTLCCVLGQDNLLSQCLCLPRCINGYQRTECCGYSFDGQATHSGGSRNTPGHFMMQKLG